MKSKYTSINSKASTRNRANYNLSITNILTYILLTNISSTKTAVQLFTVQMYIHVF